MVPQGLTLATRSQLGLNSRPASHRLSVYVRGPDKTATSTTMPKGKYAESLTFSTPNGIYANYGKLGKPSLQTIAVGNDNVILRLLHFELLGRKVAIKNKSLGKLPSGSNSMSTWRTQDTR